MSGNEQTIPSLVIFDCDGVLVDSEPLSLACLTAGLNRIGVDIDLDTVRNRFAGTSMVSIMGHIERDYGITAPAGFVDEVKAETLRPSTESCRRCEALRRRSRRWTCPFAWHRAAIRCGCGTH